ncbi:MAG: hypothetical protein QM722_01065 [Piscinibacter sp.]
MRSMMMIVAAVAATMLGGCATAIRGNTNQVTFASEPSGATVTTSLGQTCVAPCTIAIERNKEFEATFRRDGFEPAMVSVRTVVSREGGTSFAGNLLAGGLIGMGVDAATGAALDHSPNPVIGRLVALAPPPAPSPSPRGPRRHGRQGTPVAALLPQRPAPVAQPSTVTVTQTPAPAATAPPRP